MSRTWWVVSGRNAELGADQMLIGLAGLRSRAFR